MASSVYLSELVTPMLLILSLFHLRACFASPSMQQLCHDEEKAALLHFKESVAINESASGEPLAYPKTASWKVGGESGDDCCTWDGVECDKDSGHVVGLDLSSSYLYGSIDSNSSLFHLVELRRLNLTDNNFDNSEIPSGIRNFSSLSVLDLTASGFSGQIPTEILKLSKMVSLNLSLNSLKLEKPGLKDLVENLTNLMELQLTGVNISSKVPRSMANLSSLSTLTLRECGLYGEFPTEIFYLPNLRLFSIRDNPVLNGYLPEFQRDSQLETLTLAGTSFSGQLPATIGNLKSLRGFHVRGCNFSGLIPSSLGNLTNLNYLYLSSNNFSGKIPPSLVNLVQLSNLTLSDNIFSSGTLHWLCNLVNLAFVDAAQTNMYGAIPSCFRNLTQLVALVLAENGITGPLPSWMGNLTQITYLELADNKLHGPIPESIFRLQNLQVLDLASNFFSGAFKFDFLPELKNLSWLELGYNMLSIEYNHNATSALPKFQVLALFSCNLSGEFPSFLQGQDQLGFLNLENNKIEGNIPKWFMASGTRTLWFLNLGSNLLTGFEQPFDVLPWNNLRYLNLFCNNLQGSLPIPPRFIFSYITSNNKLTGEIPPMMCNLTSLMVLELSNNNMNGKLPQCLGSLSKSTFVLALRNNSFSGDIPQTFSSGCTLRVLDLSENRLEGLIPRSLANCTKLGILNLEQNKINDIFPSWLGVLPELKVLILRSNVFYGSMGNPKTNIEFPKLQIVDLSNNSFRGELPLEYFQNWTSMKGLHKENLVYMEANTSFEVPSFSWTGGYNYTMTMTNKGVMMLYDKIQESLAAIDLSSNMFEGGVSEVIGDLKALIFLNLSNNFLTGPIPPSLGNLKELEALDLSQNRLSGEIPMGLVQLNFLEVFNVSHNFLSGPIPRGNQFDTFDNSSFDANSGLCGRPLSRICVNGEGSQPAPSTSEEHEESGSLFGFGWKVVAIGYASGFVIGGIIGLFKDTRKYQLLVKSALLRRQQKVQRANRRRPSRA